MSDDLNGHLAAISIEIRYLREDIQAMDGRIRMLADDHEARLRVVEQHCNKAEERGRVTSLALAGFTVVASAIAGWLGVQK